MSISERESFLSEVQVGIVGIDEKNRSPRIVPLWYSFDPNIGITIIVKESSKKLKLLKLAMRFSLCVQKATLPCFWLCVLLAPLVGVLCVLDGY